MKTLSLAALTLMMSLSQVSFAKDVVPKGQLLKGHNYIRVTKIGSSKVRFENCIVGSEAKSCRVLGNQDAYEVSDLKAQYRYEMAQVGGTSVLAAVLGLATAYVGVQVGAIPGAILAIGNAETAGIVVALGTGAVFGASSVKLLTELAPVNPVVQYKQMKTLDSDVIEDEKVEVENVEEFSQRLDFVLSKI